MAGNLKGAIIVLLLVPLAGVALWYPIVFPYGAYAVLIPLDTLLVASAGSSVAKWLGLLAGVALLVYVYRRRMLVSPSPAVYASLIFVGLFGASLLWTVNPEQGVRSFVAILELVLVYTCAAIVPMDRRNVRRLFIIIAAGGVGMGLYATWTFAHGGHGHWDSRLALAQGNNYEDINSFADSLLLPIAICLYAWLRERRLLLKALYLLGIGTMCYAILLTASRDALIALGYIDRLLRPTLPKPQASLAIAPGRCCPYGDSSGCLAALWPGGYDGRRRTATHLACGATGLRAPSVIGVGRWKFLFRL